jgi:polyferredoxin
MAGNVSGFLGDTPGRLIVKLIIVSLIVGVAMSAFGLSPLDLFGTIRDFVMRLWNMGFSAIGKFADYLLLGACVVVPAFIVIRLFSYRR